MNISDVNNKVSRLANAWEEFKSANDQKLAEIEKKGSNDVLLNEKIGRINNFMDECKNKIENIETSLDRPSVALESKSRDAHSNAFMDYVRKGADDGLRHFEKKSMLAGDSSEGGFLVSSAMSRKIHAKLQENSPIRQLVSSDSISSSSLEFVEDFEDVGAGWAEELDRRVETKTPKLRKRRIDVHEIYAQPKATQKLIDDAFIDVESWLVGKIADRFSKIENDAFINGDGIGKPRGILSHDAGTEHGQIERLASDVSGKITHDSLMCLYFSMKEQYASRASFLLNRKFIQDLRGLKDPSTGAYLWNPGLAFAAADTLLGLPVHTCSDMPIATDEKTPAIIMADFKEAYRIVDRQGVRVMRDPYTEKPFVKFYVTKRVGGDVTNYDAVKILTF